MSKKTILLVEDSKFFVELEKSILQRGAYEFLVAYDGKRALELVEEHNPDLILLDLNIPLVNGFEFLHVLRTEMSLRTPVIVVSTKTRDEDIRRALTSGANDFITKPLDNILLLTKVNALLDAPKIRLAPRMEQEILVTISDFENDYRGIAKNISVGGMQIFTDSKLKNNQKVELRFDLPDSDDTRSFHIFGEVAETSRRKDRETDDEGQFRVRVHFTNLSWEDYSFINTMIHNDVRSIASFLLSSPSHRTETGEHLITPEEKSSELARELNRVMNSFFDIEQLRKNYDVKYESLMDHIKDAQLDFRNLSIKYSNLKEHCLVLSILNVTNTQLTSQRTVQGLFEVVHDVLENLIGADRFDIFLHSGSDSPLKSIFTRDPISPGSVSDDLLTSLQRGELFISSVKKDPAEAPRDAPLAAVPLLVKDYFLGFILIYSLLPKRTGFSNVSFQLFNLLKSVPGFVIYSLVMGDELQNEENMLFQCLGRHFFEEADDD